MTFSIWLYLECSWKLGLLIPETQDFRREGPVWLLTPSGLSWNWNTYCWGSDLQPGQEPHVEIWSYATRGGMEKWSPPGCEGRSEVHENKAFPCSQMPSSCGLARSRMMGEQGDRLSLSPPWPQAVLSLSYMPLLSSPLCVHATSMCSCLCPPAHHDRLLLLPGLQWPHILSSQWQIVAVIVPALCACGSVYLLAGSIVWCH